MSKEAMKLALEALEVATTPFARDRQEVLRAQAALREALAEQPAQPDWEAVAADQAMTIALLRAEQPAQQQEPMAWRELCRRLYVELFHCDQQMMATLDAEGDPMWQQGATVRDVLADAKAALETSPPASKPWVGLTDEDYTTFSRNFAVNKYQARAIEAKLKEKNQ